MTNLCTRCGESREAHEGVLGCAKFVELLPSKEQVQQLVSEIDYAFSFARAEDTQLSKAEWQILRAVLVTASEPPAAPSVLQEIRGEVRNLDSKWQTPIETIERIRGIVERAITSPAPPPRSANDEEIRTLCLGVLTHWQVTYQGLTGQFFCKFCGENNGEHTKACAVLIAERVCGPTKEAST
jgi:hypothetical protein